MKKIIFLLVIISLFGTPLTTKASPASLAWLKGYILLQVESHGEAWYVNPVDFKRYYMKDGAVAYEMMRSFGLGIANTDLTKIPVGIETRFQDTDTDGDGLPDKLEEGLGTNARNADSDGDGFNDSTEVLGNFNPLGSGSLKMDTNLANRLKGKILLQVQSKGEAWYINPKDNKRYYMKDGGAAYQIMRYLSLGITNSNLDLLTIGTINTTTNNPAPVASPSPVVTPSPTPTPTASPIPSPIPSVPTITFKESPDRYYQISNLIAVDTQAAYFAQNYNNEFYVVQGTSKTKIGNYPAINPGMLAAINGKLAYLYHDTALFKDYIVYNNQKIGDAYYRITYIFDANGTLGFVAQDSSADGGKYYLVINGVKQAAYDEIDARADLAQQQVIMINGQPVYKAKKNGQMIMVHGTQEDTHYPNQNIGYPVNIDNQVAYWVIQFDNNGDSIIKNNVAQITDINLFKLEGLGLFKVNNKLTYIENLGSQQFRVNYGGQPQATYKYVSEPKEIAGKLTYVANELDKYYIVQDGQKNTSCIYSSQPIAVAGKLVFTCSQSSGWTNPIIVYDGQQVGKRYSAIDKLTAVNGKLYFVAQTVDAGKYYYFIVNQE